MNLNNFKNKKIFLVVGAASVSAVLIYLAFVYGPDFFSEKLPAYFLHKEIAQNYGGLSVEPKEQDKYFTYLSVEEIRSTLLEIKQKNEFKILFPQFSFPPGEEQTDDISFGNLMRASTLKESFFSHGRGSAFLVFMGFPIDTVFYSISDAKIKTIKIPGESEHSSLVTVFQAQSGDLKWELYVAGEISLGKAMIGSDKTEKIVSIGTPLFTLKDYQNIPDSVFGTGGFQIAFAAVKGENYEAADLKNMLLKNGKFVMIQRP